MQNTVYFPYHTYQASHHVHTPSFTTKQHTIDYITLLITLSFFIRVCGFGSTNLLVEEAYYWNYAAHLDISYLDHPPMVAFIIKAFTTVFGNNDIGVRMGSMACWLLTAGYSYRLTELMVPQAGRYAILLLSILPFFFLQSLIITPDQPLIVCWSATLYYLYRALIRHESTPWYLAGLFFGLGLLSKYTIVLLLLPTLLYLLTESTTRYWFLRKEPYLGAGIALLLFMPVIYWNATHEWVSFLFQGQRRFAALPVFSFHQWMMLLGLFLMPVGLFGLWQLCGSRLALLEKKQLRFIRLFTLVPLLFFGYVSLRHPIKFNWIGPSLLGLLPWLAALMQHTLANHPMRKPWLVTSIVLLLSYASVLYVIHYGTPERVYQTVFKKYIGWEDFTKQYNAIACAVERETHKSPVFVPLDLYNISSELSYYQYQLQQQGLIKKAFPVAGRHLFGMDSLMYRYWSKKTDYKGKPLILISTEPNFYRYPEYQSLHIQAADVHQIWSHSQGRGLNVTPYYYAIVMLTG